MTSKTYRVAELVERLNDTVRTYFSRIVVEGEVSSWMVASSGHAYFSLKEKDVMVPAVMFRRELSRQSWHPSLGDKVRLEGDLRIYGARGNYQLYVRSIEKAGRGDFYEEFLKTKENLEKEGLFDEELKRPLPEYPLCVGLVTSVKSAAIKDMVRIIRRRCGCVELKVAHAAVQGESGPAELISGLRCLQKVANMDVIIIGRGGGSIEDLWAFNDESLAREIAQCSIPVISAVGHQRDFVISDFVADCRAETPSAAAELVTAGFVQLQAKIPQIAMKLRRMGQSLLDGKKEQLVRWASHPYFARPYEFYERKVQKLDDIDLRFQRSLRKALTENRHRLDHIGRMMDHLHPEKKLDAERQALRGIAARLDEKASGKVGQGLEKLDHLEKMLDAYCPYNLLQKGYSIVYDSEGRIIKSVYDSQKTDGVRIRFAEGEGCFYQKDC